MNVNTAKFVTLYTKPFLTNEQKEPTQLLAALKNIQDLNLIIEPGFEVHTLFSAFRNDYKFYFNWSFSEITDFTKEDIIEWQSLINWFCETLQKISQNELSDKYMVFAIFIISHLLKFEHYFWDLVLTKIDDPKDFFIEKKKFINEECRVNFTMEEQDIPIWEKEKAEQFLKAESEKDVKTLGKLWNEFKNIWCHSFDMSFFRREAISFLSSYSKKYSVDIFEENTSALTLLFITRNMSVNLLTHVSKNTENQTAKLYSMLFFLNGKCKSEALSKEEKNNLVEIFTSVSWQKELWKIWLEIINKYPSRHPVLQDVFSQVLLNISDIALREYIHSVNLNSNHQQFDCRSVFSKTLMTFSQVAPLEHRKNLWRHAFNRWNDWDFGKKNGQLNTSKISCSILDYAVISYAYECLTPKQRKKECQKIRNDILSIDSSIWLDNKFSATLEYNRLLSRLQLFARASLQANDGIDFEPIDEGRNYHFLQNAQLKYLDYRLG